MESPLIECRPDWKCELLHILLGFDEHQTFSFDEHVAFQLFRDIPRIRDDDPVEILVRFLE